MSNIISPKLNCLHILRSSLSTYILLSRREKLQNMVSEKPVVIFSKNSCCMSHSIKTLFVDFGVNPTIYELDEINRGKEIEQALAQLG